MNGSTLDIDAIRYPGEKAAFIALLLASLVTLSVLGLLVAQVPQAVVILAIYGGIGWLIGWLAKVLLMASIRGHGVRVTENQYPQIHSHVQQFADRLGLNKLPEVYVLQATLMNAFATKVTRRKYVVLYSHMVDAALESGDYDEVAMILGHEMAHHAAGHVRWYGFLRLGAWVPFLYMFWSRRAEYTCDRAGLMLVSKLQPSLQGIVKLAVGRKLAASTNLGALRQQRENISRELGPTIVEIFSTHPLTVKRLTAIEDFARQQQVR